jgi:hypothetical protein
MPSRSRIVARVGEQQRLDRARPRRARPGRAEALLVAREDGDDLLLQLGQLVGRDMQDELAGARRPLPGRRQPGPRAQAALGAVEVAVGEQPLERAPGGDGLGILRPVDGEAQPVGRQLPRAAAPLGRAGLLDEPELGQLAQVPGAARRALADVLGRVGGRQRPVLGQRLQQPEANRVGQGAQLARIGQLTRLESDVSKDSFPRTTRSSTDL